MRVGSSRVWWQVGIVGLLITMGKFGAFIRDVLVSSIYGAGLQTDAFFIANAIPGLVFSGVFATIGLVFLPIYARATTVSQAEVNRTVQTGITFYLGLSLGLSLTTFLFASSLVHFIAPHANDELRILAIELTRILALGFVFSGWVGFHGAILQANKRFVWPMAVPVAVHAVAILGLLLAFLTHSGITMVATFAVIAWIIQGPIIWWPARRYYTIFPLTLPSGLVIRNLLFLSVPVFFSVSLDQINNLIGLYLGSEFGTGGVSYLSYASRLMLVLAGLFGLMLSYFVFPYFADAHARQDVVAARKLLSRSVALMVFFTTPLFLLCVVRSEELIRLVYTRGAFNSEDVAITAKILRYFAFGMLFIGAREILNRVFLAAQQGGSLLFFGVFAAGVNLIASLYFMHKIGIVGIALGTSCGAGIYVLLQIVVLLKLKKGLLSWSTISALPLAVVSGLVMVLFLRYLSFFGTGNVAFIVQSLLASLVYMIVFALIATVFRLNLSGNRL